jgi:hypothetical protein
MGRFSDAEKKEKVAKYIYTEILGCSEERWDSIPNSDNSKTACLQDASKILALLREPACDCQGGLSFTEIEASRTLSRAGHNLSVR